MNFRRLLRDFKANLLKNLCFILLITLSVTVIVGFNRSMDSYLHTVYQLWETHHLEDGFFTTSEPLTEHKIKKLENKYHLHIEKLEQVTIDLTPLHSDDTIHLRLFSTDRTLNKVAVIEGTLPIQDNEIALDPKFAEAHLYPIGSTITLSHIDYKVVGYAISPDYIYTLEEPSDFLNNPNAFGVAYTTSLGFNKLEAPHPLSTTYCFLDPNNNLDLFRTYLNDHTSLINFVDEKNNARTTTVINDVNSPKTISLIMGFLLIIIIAFIISISIKNTITTESQTIGILYSQGLVKHELLRYYLMLPVFLVSLGILIGYPIGILISKPLIAMEEVQYTVPPVAFRDTPFIFIVGVCLPLLISITITYYSLSKALNKTPLSLLRGQHSNNKVSRLEKRFTFHHFSFFPRFRLKDMIREKTSMFSLFLGVLLAMFILLTGFFFHNSVSHHISVITATFPYDYMYGFKSDSDLNKYSKQGERIAYDDFTIDIEGRSRNVGLYGVKTHSAFFDMSALKALKQPTY